MRSPGSNSARRCRWTAPLLFLSVTNFAPSWICLPVPVPLPAFGVKSGRAVPAGLAFCCAVSLSPPLTRALLHPHPHYLKSWAFPPQGASLGSRRARIRLQRLRCPEALLAYFRPGKGRCGPASWTDQALRPAAGESLSLPVPERRSASCALCAGESFPCAPGDHFEGGRFPASPMRFSKRK